MKKCKYTTEREKIVAQAISPVASELRLLDAADLISLIRLEFFGNIADLVSSAAELYFHPGTVNFGAGGEYKLDWGETPEVVLDLEIKPRDITIYAQLTLSHDHAGLEINHISFKNPSADPHENTALLAQCMNEARFVPNLPAPSFVM
ncbi:hypothetical protein GOZ89_08045 [Agrobacterium vitis]|uniref:Uncharacterized protein n=1 Tax=Agrobacterium vitis TaxID=373 RepID=A0A1S2DPS9_AGRVI|nr:hypothetical protein [Agrobacterium vitis]MBF2717182.1 hypothetical protein [Agrobacterium vitis]MCE6075034.1 hypothetical protein [Agrobacterium vitis]MCF1451696.1 hypothetical protein [Agrobacterium vitis]MCF1469085.1 hypothetical protein [Agrobacterium vitis]MCM2467560.1 hypothetical protein [Agrobacterium vitis]